MEKGNAYTLRVGLQIGRAIMKNIWSFLKKLKIELSDDPTISVLGIYLKELKSRSCRNTYTPMFITALFTIAKIWK